MITKTGHMIYFITPHDIVYFIFLLSSSIRVCDDVRGSVSTGTPFRFCDQLIRVARGCCENGETLSKTCGNASERYWSLVRDSLHNHNCKYKDIRNDNVLL